MTNSLFFKRSNGMLCFQNIFRINVTNRKVGKTNSMVILNTNIKQYITKFSEFTAFPDYAQFTHVVLSNSVPKIFKFSC